MATQKYDVAKTFKFSDRDLEKLSEITDEKHFKSDGEANRFCINLVYALSQKNLLAESVSRIIEDM